VKLLLKTDSLFYRLLQAEPTLAFELAGLAVPEPARTGWQTSSHGKPSRKFIASPPCDWMHSGGEAVQIGCPADLSGICRNDGRYFMALAQNENCCLFALQPVGDMGLADCGGF